MYLILRLAFAFFALVFQAVNCQICSTNNPSLIQNSELSGLCSTAATASDKITRSSSQVSLTGLQIYSFSGWVKILSTATQPEYSLFRLTQNTSSMSAVTDTDVILTVLINRSLPVSTRVIKVQYAKTGVPSTVSSTLFAFTDDTWFFLWVSYNAVGGFIYYAAWLPNFTTEIKIGTNIPLTANFHVALTSAASIEVLYWGSTYTTFCGHLNRFVYYPNYSISNTDWQIQALSDPSRTDTTFLYLKLEASDPITQAIIDFSGRTVRNDAVLGMTSSVEASDPSVALSNSNGFTLTTGKLITINDHVWGSQDGFVVSFWARFPSGQTISADADSTDGVSDIMLISKKTAANTFKILQYAGPSLKVIINGIVYSHATKVLTTNTWYQISVSVALYSSATDFYNYYILKIDYSDSTTSGYIKMATSTLWDESSLSGLTLGSTANAFTTGILLSQLKVKAGLGVYYGTLNCITNCIVAFAKYSSISCLACASSYFEQNGVCYLVCDTSSFGLQNSNYRTCSTCGSTCSQCYNTVGSPSCTSCNSGYYLLGTSCVVSASCGAGYVANTVTQVCSQCGNGVIDGAEECDDGNFNDYDGCTNCLLDPGYYCSGSGPQVCTLACGNGIRAADEGCDDGNYIADDGCTNCIIDAGYTCTAATPNVCSSLCGNGIINVNEECDDNNTVKGDGCTDCRVELGYTCTVANPSVCTSQCGNGTRDPGEQCDDNNAVVNDGCTNCKIDSGYSCSGGSSIAADVCVIACSNGVVDEGEECDDSNTTNGDGCSSSCTVETDYDCGTASPSVCTHITSTCGNGLRTSSESCDIGASVGTPTSGCTAACVVAVGFTCTGGSTSSPDTCTPVCGDGLRVGTEQCDDGNVLVGDGCDQNCKIEENFTCSGGSSTTIDTCISLCGNGTRDPSEQCDDENQTNGDGCSQYCTIEVGYSCTQIVSGGRDSCYLCADNCLTCTSKSIKDCSVCYPTYFKNSVTGRCDLECSDGYYADDTTDSCKVCYDGNCKNCHNGATGQCYSCLNDMYVAEGKCYSECPIGYYPSLNPITGKECTPCTSPCSGCTSATDCFQCSDLYYLNTKTGNCDLCNMGPNCYQCEASSQTCTKCAIGYKISGKTCSALPQQCGDGYYQPSSEQCDDGNTSSSDGCSATCKIESNYGCVLVENQGPSDCYQLRATKVTSYESEVDYSVIFIKFERLLQNQIANLTQSDVIIKVNGLKSKQYNYTSVFLSNDTIKVTFSFSLTVRDGDCTIDFSKKTRAAIIDKYNYTLTGSAYSAITASLPYFIYYSSSEKSVSEVIGWLYVSIAILLLGPIFAYLYYFSQGRVFKYIEVIQVIALFRFFSVRWDILADELFMKMDLIFNFRGFYSVFDSIPIGADDLANFESVDSLVIQRQRMNSSFLHSFLGVFIFLLLLIMIFQGINALLYKFVENDKVSQVTEKIKEFMEWDVYVKFFEFIFFFCIISVFIALKSYSFATILSVVNFVLAILIFVALIALAVFIVKKRVKYTKLKLRTDWFEKYQSFFDGIKFNIPKAKIYLVFPYFLRTLYAGVLIFLEGQAFFQIIICAGLRLLNIILILVTKPFHFPFIQRRDIICELYLITMILICLNCLDDNSLSANKRIMAVVFIALSFIFIIAYSALYFWTVKQEDIYFDPIPIVPLKANPEDWISQQGDHEQENEDDNMAHSQAGSEAKRKPILPLQAGSVNSDDNNQQDDFGMTKQIEMVKPTGGIVGHFDEDEEEDIFAPKKAIDAAPSMKSQPDHSDEDDEGNISQHHDINDFQR